MSAFLQDASEVREIGFGFFEGEAGVDSAVFFDEGEEGLFDIGGVRHSLTYETIPNLVEGELSFDV